MGFLLGRRGFQCSDYGLEAKWSAAFSHQTCNNRPPLNFFLTPPNVSARGPQTYLIKHVLELVLSQRAAFDIFHRAQVLGHALAVLAADGAHLLLGKLFAHAGIIPQVDLGTDNQARDAGAVVVDLGEPLLANVFERGGRRDAEADEEDVGLGV